MTYKIVERLKGQKRATQFNSAGELQVHLCEPSSDDLEAASLIQELGEALMEARDMLRSCRVEDDAEAHEAWNEGLATVNAAIAKLKDES